MGRPEMWPLPLIPTPASLVEATTEFKRLVPHILNLPEGYRKLISKSHNNDQDKV